MRLRLIITNTFADQLIQSGLVVDKRAYLKELGRNTKCSLSVYGIVASTYILSNDREKPAEDSLAEEMMLIPSVEARLIYINN